MNEKQKPKIAFFDFAGCEGDQLQIVNLEEKLLELTEHFDIVEFRENIPFTYFILLNLNYCFLGQINFTFRHRNPYLIRFIADIHHLGHALFIYMGKIHPILRFDTFDLWYLTFLLPVFPPRPGEKPL